MRSYNNTNTYTIIKNLEQVVPNIKYNSLLLLGIDGVLIKSNYYYGSKMWYQDMIFKCGVSAANEMVLRTLHASTYRIVNANTKTVLDKIFTRAVMWALSPFPRDRKGIIKGWLTTFGYTRYIDSIFHNDSGFGEAVYQGLTQIYGKAFKDKPIVVIESCEKTLHTIKRAIPWADCYLYRPEG